MKSTIIQPTSRIRVYWYVWLGVAGLALLLRFTVFLSASSGRLFALASAYGLGTWIPIMVLNFVEGRRLSSYLRIHHPGKWEWLTYVPGLGSGMHNGFRSLPWLFSSDDLGDPVVAGMKNQQRRFLYWVLTVFFSYFVVMPALLGL
jgi:hypothetical protein